jgi:hypothetical protein
MQAMQTQWASIGPTPVLPGLPAPYEWVGKCDGSGRVARDGNSIYNLVGPPAALGGLRAGSDVALTALQAGRRQTIPEKKTAKYANRILEAMGNDPDPGWRRWSTS